jgi:serine/threonine-protein kinase
VITLTLLHPIQSIPVQRWCFEQDSIIRIGRSTDNNVILYSAVVSRHHVELRQVGSGWEIINLGANGTYLDGKRITQVPVEDGVIIRLARSGPNIQIQIGKPSQSLEGETTLAQRIRQRAAELAAERGKSAETRQAEGNANPSSAVAGSPQTDFGEQASNALAASELAAANAIVDDDVKSTTSEDEHSPDSPSAICTHPRAGARMVFCIDCGQPLKVLQTVGGYSVLQTLSDDRVGRTHLAWRNGQQVLLRTLKPDWLNYSDVLDAFEQQANQLLYLSHPGIPRFLDYFKDDRGCPCLVMEQIPGQDLRQRITTQGVLSQSQAIATILQVCDVLNYLHQQNPPLLHQDISPEHLLQSTNPATPGQVTVIGFLSRKALETNPELTTMSYMGYTAPEQLQGYASPSSDVFAIGPTLVYLLTGKDPSAFYAQREQGFRFYPEYVPGLTPDLVHVIRQITHPSLEERYATAEEIAAALTPFIQEPAS